MLCASCQGPLKERFQASGLTVSRCLKCGTYHGQHKKVATGIDAWQSQSITPLFLDTLRRRRLYQSEKIFKHFQDLFKEGPLLDYGCGQGAFVSYLLSKGVDARGCDYSDSSTSSVKGEIGDRILPLKQSWGMPKQKGFSVISLFDVLEHCPEPKKLIDGLSTLGARHLLIKVPLADGPGFFVGKLGARFGSFKTIEKLFLAGDIAPHISYFTRKSLVRLLSNCGFKFNRALGLAEVGRELPDRIRGETFLRKEPSRSMLKFAGYGIEFFTPIWADTAVFEFTKI